MSGAFNPKANASVRPASRWDAAKVFVECVSCGAYKVLSQDANISDDEAKRRIDLVGWSLAGHRGRKSTRCRTCRRAGRRHRRFARSSPVYGEYSRGNPLLRPRMP